jgi:cysteine desulfurase
MTVSGSLPPVAVDECPPVVYLDHAATAPLRPEVAEAMAPFASGRYGNASGSHRLARDARRALEEAREEVAEVLGCAPGEVVFTSGGTESDNLAVQGVLRAATDGGPVPPSVVCSAVEHAAVLEPCRAVAPTAGRHGGPPVTVREAPVDAGGVVDLDRLEGMLDSGVALVSVMLANNEVGTVQPVDLVADAVRRRAPAAVVHTDAVQAAGWVDVGRATATADLVSVSAHKLGGPKGSGALVVRAGTPLAPLLHGGGQEQERRSGTHDVGAAVGLAAALRLAADEREVEGARVRVLRDRLADGLLSAVDGTVESAPRDRVLPGHCHLRFRGIEQEELLVLLDEQGICASAGAACASGALEPSHVLRAMGVPDADARGAVRFTLGRTTGEADVARALAVVPCAVDRLRG